MQYAAKLDTEKCQMDMTPMIDVTFQLVIFFLLTLNFSSDVQSEIIRLPSSELAKPADAPFESAITIQVTSLGKVLFGAEEPLSVEEFKPLLLREAQILDVMPGKSRAAATIIIRADRSTEIGKVQEVIRICQELKFEKFVLRAKQERRT